MRSLRIRILCFVLILAMLPGFFALGATEASAAYENTWKNTGDMRTDLIQVALTQVGYTEGSNNYTKYGVWYGAANTAWCGVFISWCANQAGIPTSILRRNGWATIRDFGITDIFKYSSGRQPRPGDLYMKNDGSHVGIVYYVEGSYFYTIEGNTSSGTSSNPNCVAIKRKSLTGAYTFGSPNYTSDSGHNYKSYTESAHPHREYMHCDHCNHKYYTGKTTTSSSCTTCIQNNCSHNYGAWEKLNDSSHQRTCAKCSKTETKSHSWNTGTVTKPATCKEAGTREQTCKTCDAQRTVSIAKLTTHTYGSWEYMDEELHYRQCTVCQVQEKKEHARGDTWETDLFYHWFTCTDCEGKAGLHEHVFADGCEEPCDECQYLRPSGHVFSNEWTYDDKGHWHACENCTQRGSAAEHTFDSECDETCADCDFIRVTQHDYPEEFSSNAQGHFLTCQVCGDTDVLLPHTPGEEATEQAAQLCLDCGYVITPKLVHVHDFQPMSTDARSHWGQCRCGEPYPREDHTWDVNTGICTVCGLELQQQEEKPGFVYVFHPYHLLPIIGILLILCVILMVKILKNRSKKKKKVPVGV